MSLSHEETDWDAIAAAVDANRRPDPETVDPIWLPTLPVSALARPAPAQPLPHSLDVAPPGLAPPPAMPPRGPWQPQSFGTPTRMPASQRKGKRPPRSRILFALCFVASWAVLGWVLLVASAPKQPKAPFAVTVPVYPKAWDPRVADLAAFVEAHRGLTYKHPVPVQFLAEADYIALFDTNESSSDAATKAQIAANAAKARDDAAILDAAGLAPAGYDPVAASTTVAQTTTLGFFDPQADKVFVRGNTMTPALRVVLVHELTHVLQSQWFTIKLGGANDLDVRAVVEADAIRIQDEYQATLPAADQTQAEAGNGASASSAADLADVPAALVDQSYAPYVLGPMFVKTIADKGGNAAVDKLFTSFPGDRDLVNPALYTGTVDEIVVPVSAPSGATVIAQPHLWSMFDALTMLDAWLPWRDARTPFDAWTGGGYVSYRRADSVLCFTAAARFSTDVGASGFSNALTLWAAASGSTAVPARDGLTVSFEACARPAGAAAPPKAAFSSAQSVLIENQLLGDPGEETDPGKSVDRCVARKMVDDATLAPLYTADTLTDAQRTMLAKERDLARWTCTAEASAG